ncbi:MAG TPA: class I SAM-dependent methyltransferase [Bacillales bacterium]
MNNNEKWNEEDTDLFIRYGRILVPERDELANHFADLIPASRNEAFVAVDIAAGGGWLTETIVRNYPKAHVIVLDGSPGMLKHTEKRLAAYAARLEFREFDLHDSSWYEDLRDTAKCFVSSLAIHHLDLQQKQDLFKNLYEILQQNGALLIADIVKPAGESSRRRMSQSWDEMTKKQALELEGHLQAYDFFLNERWNLFEYPDDPIDKPSTLLEQLNAMSQAGFSDVDVWWAKAGHALFGGYKYG